jgi:hypothetical protein
MTRNWNLAKCKMCRPCQRVIRSLSTGHCNWRWVGYYFRNVHMHAPIMNQHEWQVWMINSRGQVQWYDDSPETKWAKSGDRMEKRELSLCALSPVMRVEHLFLFMCMITCVEHLFLYIHVPCNACWTSIFYSCELYCCWTYLVIHAIAAALLAQTW